MVRNRGYKTKLQSILIAVLKKCIRPGIIYNAPREAISFSKWIVSAKEQGYLTTVYNQYEREEGLPEMYNYPLTQRFKKYKSRVVPEACIATIKGGAVYGRYTNIILFPPYFVSADFSREFGAYGGLNLMLSKLISHSLWLPKPHRLKGKMAVITTEGADNFHHWLYDCMPRIFLLKQSGHYDSVDYFLISYNGQPFQKESLKRLGIPECQIINPQKENSIYFAAETLIVPSLPSMLGTVSPWVVSFLNDLFNTVNKTSSNKRIFISRKKVTTRQITNNEEVQKLLKVFKIVEVFPEDYNIVDFASIVADADFIISVHGSGLSNLCFASPKTVVVDLLAPHHQDCYYWLISNIRASRYIGFFSEGEHPDDEVDLVRNKVNENLKINIHQLQKLLTRELN